MMKKLTNLLIDHSKMKSTTRLLQIDENTTQLTQNHQQYDIIIIESRFFMSTCYW